MTDDRKAGEEVGIHHPMNACCFRDQCKEMERALAESRAEALIDAKVIDSLINSNQELQAISARLASELSNVIARAGSRKQFITAAGALSDYAALNLEPTP